MISAYFIHLLILVGIYLILAISLQLAVLSLTRGILFSKIAVVNKKAYF